MKCHTDVDELMKSHGMTLLVGSRGLYLDSHRFMGPVCPCPPITRPLIPPSSVVIVFSMATPSTFGAGNYNQHPERGRLTLGGFLSLIARDSHQHTFLIRPRCDEVRSSTPPFRRKQMSVGNETYATYRINTTLSDR